MTERHIEVQDRRNPGWFWSSNALIDNHLPEIGMQAFAVYMLLTRYANSDGQCYPAMSTIAARLGVGISTVQRAIKALTAAGLLRVSSGKKKGDCNIYTLISAEGGRSQGTRGVGHTDLPGRSHRPTEQDPINKTQLNKKNTLQSADADVQSAPSHPQSSDGRNSRTTEMPNAPTGAENAQVDDAALEDRIPDLPKSSAKKVSADTAPTVKRAPLPHIGVIEAFLAPFLKDLPADFKIGSCARVGMDLVKAGVTIDTMREAGLLYRAWYDTIPSRTGVSWSVAAISSATSFARHMAADPMITPEYVTKYVAHIYQDEWWHDKLLTFKKVYENIGVWLHHGESPRKPATAPAIEMDENGMPIGYREMQEARRRADAIVAEKRRNGELR